MQDTVEDTGHEPTASTEFTEDQLVQQQLEEAQPGSRLEQHGPQNFLQFGTRSLSALTPLVASSHTWLQSIEM